MAGNARWPARTTLPACSNQGEGKVEMLSRRFLVMAWIFSGKKRGLFIGGRGSTR
jgi:hypothetical protein